MNEDFEGNLIATQAIVEKILSLMGISANVIAQKEGANIVIVIKSNDAGLLIGKDGKCLNALQEITQTIFFKKTGLKKRLVLDINDYRKRRKESIIKFASEAANKAFTTKEEVVIPPMPSYERYIVHSFLQSDHRVTTMSQGEGDNRCVVVIPNA
ncbi:MAG: R3H domain-containing nucleic acid-binding protein [bacterium]